MKKIYFLLTFILFAALAVAQDGITICHTPATEKFAMLASNKEFNASHASPRKYVHVSQAGGEMIKFKCADGTEANGYLLKAAKPTNKWIFVIQEWWGLNDNIKRQSEELFKDLGNVNVLALDMYDGKVAIDKENAGKYMQEFKQERGDAIVKGALAYAGKSAKIGTVGWCFGGGQSLQAAINLGKNAIACVMFYGPPEEDVNRLKKLNCDVLNIWGTKDGWINVNVIDKFDSNMKAAGKSVIHKSYEAEHAFANPSNPLGTFNEAAYKDSYKVTVEFFKARLK